MRVPLVPGAFFGAGCHVYHRERCASLHTFTSLAIKLRTHLERAAHRKPSDPGMPLMKKSVNPCNAASYKRLERNKIVASRRV